MVENIPDEAQRRIAEKFLNKSLGEFEKTYFAADKVNELKIHMKCKKQNTKQVLTLRLIHISRLTFDGVTISTDNNIGGPFTCDGLLTGIALKNVCCCK